MTLTDTRNEFLAGHISKPDFIHIMYERHHSKLFDYGTYLKQTNIASIEITDDSVIMTSRDNGIRMACPTGDYRVAPVEALNFLDYESEDSAMIMKLVAAAQNIVDIGANMGWYSINIAKTFPDCHVYAFEPIPRTFDFLERNVQLNNINNINIYPFGLSNERKDLTFYYYSEGSGNASSANLSERADADLITCHVERLDDVVDSLKLRVDFIKCDVEGAELFAFQGGLETLKRDKPIVFTEMLRKWAAKFNYHPNEIINIFSSIGYRCFYVENGGLCEIGKMTDDTVQTNYFFLHGEPHKDHIYSLCGSK